MRLYTAAKLLRGASADVVRDGGVLVDGARIVAAGPSGPLRAQESAEVIDLGDVTVLPGLIDAHVHLGFDGGPGRVARMRAETDAEQLILMLHGAGELLRAGVTTARDLGARAFLDIAVRDAIARGTADGPRLVTAARPLTPAGGHCWFMGGECDSADELRRMVRLHHTMGADLIKVMSTGGFMTEGSAPRYAQFTPGELRAVVEEAHRLGKRVAAARALGVDDRTGSIEPGKDADLIAVRGDPLRDISALHPGRAGRGARKPVPPGAGAGLDAPGPAAGMGRAWPNPPGRAAHDGVRRRAGPDIRR